MITTVACERPERARRVKDASAVVVGSGESTLWIDANGDLYERLQRTLGRRDYSWSRYVEIAPASDGAKTRRRSLS